MSENTAEVKITGDGSGAIAAVKQTEAAVKDGFAGMKQAMEAVNAQFAKVQKSFMALVAVAAGGAAFKSAIDASVNWSLETGKLAKVMGATTEQASVMNVALTRLGLSGDTYQQAAVGLSRQLNTNARAFEIMGIQTKGADGHLRSVGDLMPEINTKLAAIKNPLEQNIAGMQIYGKSWQDLKPLLRLNAEAMAEAEKRARDLGLIVGPEGEARAKLYKAQMRDLDLVGKSLSIQFGNQLLPIFTSIGSVMAKEGPTAARIFGDALKGVASAGITLWYTLQGIGTLIGGIGAAAGAVLTGNFSQARAIMGMAIADIDALEEKRKAAVAGVWNPSASPVQASKPDISTPYDFSKGKDDKDKTSMPAFEEALAKYKLAYAQINDGRELDKEREAAYWEAVLQAADLIAQDRIKIETKVAEIRVQILKNERKQRDEINAVGAKNDADLALGRIESAKAAADALVEADRLTVPQRAALEVQFEEQRYAIQKEALAKKLDLLQQDPTTNPVKIAEAHAQALIEEQQYQTKRLQLQTAANKAGEADNKSLTSTLQSNFAQILTTFAQGGTTISSLFKQIGASILNTFIGIFAQIAAQWLAQQVMMAVGRKVTATATVMSESAKAGAGGTASMAAAPFPLNLGAPAFGAAMAAAALGYAAPAASAAGGFDIPTGVNPITQLHAREMVLPAPIADTVRNAMGSSDSGNTIHIHAQPSDFIRASDLGKMLTSMRRNFEFVGR